MKIFLLLFYVDLVISQSCREYGKACNDDKACCGGCCMFDVCTDIYTDCRIRSNPCLEYPCPPDEDCYLYQPKDCAGCALTPQCKESLPAPSEIIANSSVSSPPINAATNSRPDKLFITSFPIILFIKLL